MKIQCKIEVQNRQNNQLNINSNGKYLNSTLALGKEPKNQSEYCIIHFSSANKTGTKYNVKNIKQVFIKFMNEGKATIKFNEPPHDLYIKCEKIQLKCFMQTLKSCIVGDTKHLQISSPVNLTISAKDIAPRKLVILDRGDFPVKGLPRTLETLYINGLNLCNFRREILLLKNLTVLDLTNNEIKNIPPEFGLMPNLRELHMANNELGKNGHIDWRWLLGPQIGKTLKLLDLSGNKLRYLAKSIWKLHNLITLKLDNNKLRYLPASVGHISNLRYITMSGNKLQTLPCSLMQCHLEYLEISSNRFHREDIQQRPDRQNTLDCSAESLVHLAAKVVLRKKIFYTPRIIPRTLVDLLENAKMCICGGPVLNDMNCLYKEVELKDHFSTVVFNNSPNSVVSIECYYCSPRCYRKCSVY